MHVLFQSANQSLAPLLDAAYQAADKILQSDAVQKFTQVDDLSVGRDIPNREDATTALEEEAERFASNSDTSTLAVANEHAWNGKGKDLLKYLLVKMASGNFLSMSDKASEHQEWCVD